MEKKAKLKAASSPRNDIGCLQKTNAEASMFYSSIVPGKSKGGFMHVPRQIHEPTFFLPLF